MTIFIVLGIAADDIFVFCDAWRQSATIPFIADNLHRRMAYSFKRSFNAILVTSSTTAIAFLANALSDIRPIRAFGIFAAIIIPVNFVLVILVMPSTQIIHDKYLKDRCSFKKFCIRMLCSNAESSKTKDGGKKAKDNQLEQKDQKNGGKQGG